MGATDDELVPLNTRVCALALTVILRTVIETFTVPPVTSNIGKVPPSLTYHTANLVDNYMIIAFGKYIFILFYNNVFIY